MSRHEWGRVRSRKETAQRRRGEQTAAARQAAAVKRANDAAERAAVKQRNDTAEARWEKWKTAYDAWVAAGAQGEFVSPDDVAPFSPPEAPPGPFTKALRGDKT
jgi:hypothetical protein